MYIFDYIVEQCHIDFISDIKRIPKSELYHVLKDADYVGTKEEWEELLSYLAKLTHVSNSPQEAKEYLLNWLNREISK